MLKTNFILGLRGLVDVLESQMIQFERSRETQQEIESYLKHDQMKSIVGSFFTVGVGIYYLGLRDVGNALVSRIEDYASTFKLLQEFVYFAYLIWVILVVLLAIRPLQRKLVGLNLVILPLPFELMQTNFRISKWVT